MRSLTVSSSDTDSLLFQIELASSSIRYTCEHSTQKTTPSTGWGIPWQRQHQNGRTGTAPAQHNYQKRNNGPRAHFPWNHGRGVKNCMRSHYKNSVKTQIDSLSGHPFWRRLPIELARDSSSACTARLLRANRHSSIGDGFGAGHFHSNNKCRR